MNSHERTTDDRIDAAVWRLSGVVLLGSVMSVLDTTIVNVALAHARPRPALVRVPDPVGRDRVLAGARRRHPGRPAGPRGASAPSRSTFSRWCLFTAGSALCGLATSTGELVVFRVLQGIGGGMLLPIGQLMMAEAAGPKRMGRVMSIVAVPVMLAPILGPTIGGADRPEHQLALDLLRQRPDRRHRRDRGAGRSCRAWSVSRPTRSTSGA